MTTDGRRAASRRQRAQHHHVPRGERRVDVADGRPTSSRARRSTGAMPRPRCCLSRSTSSSRPSIAAPQTDCSAARVPRAISSSSTAAACRSLSTSDDVASLLAGEAVDVATLRLGAVALGAGDIASRRRGGRATGIDVDRVVLISEPDDAAAAAPPPTVTVERTRTTRTATVSELPRRVLVDPRRGLQRRLEGDGRLVRAWVPHGRSPAASTAGGCRLRASPVTVTMTWTPQRTMWIGMAPGRVGGARLRGADLARPGQVPSVRCRARRSLDWPSATVGRRRGR